MVSNQLVRIAMIPNTMGLGEVRADYRSTGVILLSNSLLVCCLILHILRYFLNLSLIKMPFEYISQGCE